MSPNHENGRNERLRELADSLEGRLVRPTDADYDEVRALFNGMIDRHPGAIARCASVDDVRRSVTFAREQRLPLSIRGGGHNVAGNALCDGGLVIDMSERRRVAVSAKEGLAHAEAGARWADFDAATQAEGLATTGGLVSTTGIAGFTLGGGVGWLVRKHGLACDNLVAADLVTADGEVLHASESEHPDLLWGLRGGGGNFGVVTSFEYRLHPLDQVFGGLVAHPLEKAPEVLRFVRDFVADAPDELTVLAAMLTAPDGIPVIGVAACYAGDLAAGERLIAPLRSFGPPAMDLMAPMPYTELQTHFDDSAPAGMQNYWKSDFLGSLSDEAIETLAAHAVRRPSPMMQVHIHLLGGAMARVSEEATAFAHRDAPFLYNIIGMWSDRADSERNTQWVRELWEEMRPLGSGAYINFLADEDPARVRSAYGGNYERLVAVKDKYDPANLFHFNQNIPPSAPGTA